MCHCNYFSHLDSSSFENQGEGVVFEAECVGIGARGWDYEETKGG
jgi:hypothetical protein